MIITCPLSGIEYTTNYGIGKFQQIHPTLSLSTHELRKITRSQLINRINRSDDKVWQTNSYLLLLSWLLKLPKITVTHTINISTALPVLLANQEQLVSTVNSVEATKHKIKFPGVIISDESTLEDNLVNWLDTYNECIRESNVLASRNARQKTAAELEQALEEVVDIFLPATAKKHALTVAKWAATAGNFPKSVSALWQEVIICLFRADDKKLAQLEVTEADIDELIEHCEDNIPHGSYHAHELMAKLRSTMSIITRQTLNSTNSTVNTTVIEHDGELSEPQEADYETRLDYLKAKADYLTKRVRVTKVSKGGIVSDLEL